MADVKEERGVEGGGPAPPTRDGMGGWVINSIMPKELVPLVPLPEARVPLPLGLGRGEGNEEESDNIDVTPELVHGVLERIRGVEIRYRLPASESEEIEAPCTRSTLATAMLEQDPDIIAGIIRKGGPSVGPYITGPKKARKKAQKQKSIPAACTYTAPPEDIGTPAGEPKPPKRPTQKKQPKSKAKPLDLATLPEFKEVNFANLVQYWMNDYTVAGSNGESQSEGSIELHHLQTIHSELKRLYANGKDIKSELSEEEQLFFSKFLHDIIILGKEKRISGEDQANDSNLAQASRCLKAQSILFSVIAQTRGLSCGIDDTLVESAVLSLRFHLTRNVLAVCDHFSHQLYRSDETLPTTGPSKKRKAGSGANTLFHAPWFADVTSLVADSLSCLREVITVISIGDSFVLQLCRACVGSIGVKLPFLQSRVTDVIVSVFHVYCQHRQAILLEMVNAILGISTTKVRGSNAKSNSVDFSVMTAHPSSVLVMLSLQSLATVPPAEGGNAVLMHGLESTMECSNLFWRAMLENIAAGRGEESNAKHVMDRLVQDLLSMRVMSEYPTADLLLFRLCCVLNSSLGLKHEDSAMRQLSIDIIGRILKAVRKTSIDSKDDCQTLLEGARGDSSWQPIIAFAEKRLKKLATMVDCSLPPEKKPARIMALEQVLLDKLKEYDMSWIGGASAARNSIVCLSLSEQIKTINANNESGEQGNGKKSEEKTSESLRTFQRIRLDDNADTFPENFITGNQLFRISCALSTEHALCKVWRRFLSWILEACRSSPEPGTRGRAMKALSAVVEVDGEILMIQEVQNAVRYGFVDKSITVREAALDLVGKHPLAATQLLGTVAQSLSDPGVSVKKRALRILQDVCISSPDLPEIPGIIHSILRIFVETDEESIQDLVCKLISDLWYKDSAPVEKRLGQIILVCDYIYREICRASNNTIRLPFKHDNPLIAIIKKLVDKEEGTKSFVVRNDTMRFSAILVNDIVDGSREQVRGKDSNGFAFTRFLMLHALCQANPKLCVSGDERTQDRSAELLKTVITLAPYLKPSSGSVNDIAGMPKNAAEETIALVFTLDGLIPHCKRIPNETAQEVCADLIALVKSTTWLPLASACCQCLCSLSAAVPSTSGQVISVVSGYKRFLSLEAAHIQKSLHTIGHIARQGASPSHPLESFLSEMCGEICDVYHTTRLSAPDTQKVQKFAVDAIGCFVFANHVYLDQPRVSSIFTASLTGKEPRLQVAVLTSLCDILKAREEADSNNGATRKRVGSSSSRGKPNNAGTNVPTEAGHGDIPVESKLLQLFWKPIVSNASSPHAFVRFCSLETISIILRNGLVHPATAYDRLFSALVDKEKQIRTMGERMLKQEMISHAALIDSALHDGLLAMYNTLQAHYKEEKKEKEEEEERLVVGTQAMSTLYSMRDTFNDRRNLARSLLRGHRREFSGGGKMQLANANGARGGGGGVGQRMRPLENVGLLSFSMEALGNLPFIKVEEVLYVISAVNDIISTRGDQLQSEIDALLKREERKEMKKEKKKEKIEEEEEERLLQYHCHRGALLLSQLLLLKRFLKQAYGLNEAKIKTFAAAGGGGGGGGGGKGGGFKEINASRSSNARFTLNALALPPQVTSSAVANKKERNKEEEEEEEKEEEEGPSFRESTVYFNIFARLVEEDGNDFASITALKAKARPKRKKNAQAPPPSPQHDTPPPAAARTLRKRTTRKRKTGDAEEEEEEEEESMPGSEGGSDSEWTG